jgi:hypothetical protein
MKIKVATVLLGLVLAGCIRPPVDVLFESDPRILRGTWTGTLEKSCNARAFGGVYSPDNSKVYFQTSKSQMVLDTATGAILAELQTPTPSPRSVVVWNNVGTKLKYILEDTSYKRFLLEVDAQNGSILSSSALPTAFSGYGLITSPDLKLAAKIENNQIRVLDLETKQAVKTIAVTGNWHYETRLTSTHLAYGINANSVRLQNIATGAEQTFEGIRSSQVSLTATHLYAPTNTTPSLLRKISLADATNTDLPIPNFNSAVFSSDGTQLAFIASDTVFVHSLSNGSVVGQAALGTVNAAKYPQEPSIVAAGQAGNYLLTAANPACGVRGFVATTGFGASTTLETPTNDPIVFSFTPTFQNSSGYTLTGTMKIGNAAPQNITGRGLLPQQCSLYSTYGNCEQLKPAALPPYYLGHSQLKNPHRIELLTETGEPVLGENLNYGAGTLYAGFSVKDNSVQLLSSESPELRLYNLKASKVVP